MADIELRLFATLSSLAPPGTENYAIGEGLTVRELLEQLKLPPAEAKLIFVNGVRAEPDTTLHGGERVGIFPPVGGG
jgi:molybdopterin converting factor small subunit